MNNLKLTEWFPATVKPVHEGVYQVYISSCFEEYAMWKNGEWSLSRLTKDGDFRFVAGRYQNKDWRGVQK
jgi:hypothetical protein